MGKNKETSSTENPIQWTVDEPAPKAEVELFWKKLRQFYRTGEKVENQKKLSSPLLSLLEDSEENYPFIVGEKKETSIGFEPQAPLLMLNQLLTEHQGENRKKFKSKLSTLIRRLNERLSVDEGTSEADEMKQTYDFVNEIMAFDQLAEMIPQGSNDAFSEGELNRIKEVVKTLKAGLSDFSEQTATLVIDKKLMEQFDVHSIFENEQLIEAKQKDAFDQIQKLFEKRMQSFTALIKAYRMAMLEVEGDYKEDVHDEYFEHFTWYRIFDEELALFHPLVLLIGHDYLVDRLTSFSKLLSSNQPINVIVLNQKMISEPNLQTSWDDASHQFRQELAAVAISHRNTYTFQAGIDDPVFLHKGLEGSIKSTSPALCQVLLPEKKSSYDTTDFLCARAASVSRYFPKIIYDPGKGSEWGSRFDVKENVQVEKTWPHYSLVTNTLDKKESIIDVAFTYANYKAIYPAKVNELMHIPSAYYTEHLVPLNEYLELEDEKLYGKVPFAWLVDSENNLQRAAVPNVWVVSCQERLDFWNFIQELGGINSYHVKEAVKQKEVEMLLVLEEEKKKLEADHQQAMAKMQEVGMGQAAERLINILLDEEGVQLESSLTSDNNVPKEASSAAEEVVTEKSTEATEAEVVASSEAWLDTPECTSCNDCTDQSPKLFKYNEDKLAYITDPSNGTYAELVKAAEKCPAACIHPGLPINQKEPNLAKFIKRAEKFN